MKPDTYSKEDVDLMSTAIAIYPELEASLHLIRAVRKAAIPYPIKNVDDVRKVFTKTGKLAVGMTVISFDQVQKFAPHGFFPIESEEDLLYRAMLTFRIGASSHAYDKLPAFKDSSDYETIPSPFPMSPSFDRTKEVSHV